MVKDWSIQIDIKKLCFANAKHMRKTCLGQAQLYLTGKIMDNHMDYMDDLSFLELLICSADNLQKLNGCFAGVLITPYEILLITDRALTSKLFFTIDEDRIYVAGNADTVAKMCPRRPEINFVAWGEMLKWNSLLSNHTYYKYVYGMKIGKIAVVNRKNGDFNWYCYDSIFGKGIIDDRPINMVAKELSEKLIECISNLNKHLKQKMAATITGGLDSRVLLGIIKNLGINPPLFTCDSDGGYDEYEIVRPLLNYLRYESKYYPVENDYYEKYADLCYSQEGYMCLQHVWFTSAAFDPVHHGRVYIMGIGGGELLRFNNGNPKTAHLEILFTEDKIDSLTDSIFSLSHSLHEFLDDEFLTMINKSYMNSIRDSISPFLDKPRGAMDWFLINKLFNQVVYFFPMFKNNIEGISPFLCSDVLNILYSINPKCTDWYVELYKNVDSSMLSFLSTRSKNISEYKIPTKIHTSKVAKFIHNDLLEGPLVLKGYINKDKINKYIKTMHEKNQFYITYDLRAIFAMNNFFKRFDEI